MSTRSARRRPLLLLAVAAVAVGVLWMPGNAASSGSQSGGFYLVPPGGGFGDGVMAGLAVGDVNGDGRPDLVFASSSGGGGVGVLPGDGKGGFDGADESVFLAGGSDPSAVALGDLNGDGNLDVAVANSGSGTVGVLLGDGSGGFSAASGSPFSVGSSPSALAIGDLNGDGDPDLVVANSADNTVSVLLGDGSGGFSPASGSPFSVGTNPASVAIADLNGDGHPDLAVANENDNTVTVLAGDGSGGFSPASGSPFAVGASPVSVAIADLNGDGRPDLVTANLARNVTVLLGNPSGSFDPGHDFSTAGEAESIAIGDMNGDGHPDLVVGDSAGQANILLGDGSGSFSPEADSPIAIDDGASINAIAIADFNNDDRPDIAALAPTDLNITVQLAAAPGAPRSATASPGDALATVSWQAPATDGHAAITRYTVTAAPGGRTCTAAGALSCAVTGLTNGTSYTFTVTATNAVGASVASTATSAVVPAGAPIAAAAPTATRGDGSALVSWTAFQANGSPIASYSVTAAPGGRTCAWSSGPLQCTVTGLSNGTSYTFTVTATNAVGTSAASSPSNSVVPAGLPIATAAPTATGGDKQATVTWTAFDANGSPVTSYQVTASPGGAACRWSSGPLQCTVTGLSNGASYTFTVTATNAVGTGAASTASRRVVPAGTPGAPRRATAKARHGAVTVSWSPPASNGGSSITGYQVTSKPGRRTCRTHGARSCTVKSLKKGKRYSFTVRATNRVGTGPASAPAHATP